MRYEFKPAQLIAKSNDLQQHMTAGDRFPCAVCGKSYLRKRHLQRHMRDECIGIPPRFSCELCPSRFRRKYHMVRHLTSKHNIPPAVAQQATGGGMRNLNNNNNNNIKMERAAAAAAETCEISGGILTENLTLRKDLYAVNGHNHNTGHMSTSPTHSGEASSSTGGHSPLPAHLPLPTYGLSGALTALSSATVAALAGEQAQEQENGFVEGDAGGIAVKSEPISPSKSATAAAMATAAVEASDMQALNEEEWKIKLSLQLISNSLLKERLMNSIPYPTGGYDENK